MAAASGIGEMVVRRGSLNVDRRPGGDGEAGDHGEGAVGERAPNREGVGDCAPPNDVGDGVPNRVGDTAPKRVGDGAGEPPNFEGDDGGCAPIR